MRVAMLHVDLPTTGRGGVSYQVHRLANAMSNRGHDVSLFTFSPPPVDARYDVLPLKAVPTAVSRSGLGRLVGTPLAFALERYGRFDLVHAHGDSQILWRRRIPVVRTFYGSAAEEARHADSTKRRLSQLLVARAEQLAKRSATVTVGISENTARSLGGTDHVIPCGVDRDRFHPGPKAPAPAVLFVGTLQGRKRGYFVLDAFAQHIRPRVPDSELWFVGAEPEASPGVRVFGKVSDALIEQLFREAWVVAVPSTYEGFGVPYVEAMASGTAVVSTPNAGAEEMLGQQSGGMIVADEEFGSAVADVLTHPARRRELEERGRSASKPYGWGHVVQQYERVYEQARERGER